MNKEDILKILEGAKDKNGDVPMRLVRLAFKKLPEPCTDTISRQAALNLAKDICVPTKDGSIYRHRCIDPDEIRELPSAQPEPCEDTVSRQKLLSDLKELVAAWKKYPVMAEQIKGVETAIGYVEAIPPVKPTYTDEEIQKMSDLEQAEIEKAYQLGYEEGKKDAQTNREIGRWIVKRLYVQCSECGDSFPLKPQNYCSNCGSRMEGDEHE